MKPTFPALFAALLISSAVSNAPAQRTPAPAATAPASASQSRPAHIVYATPMDACIAYCKLTLDGDPGPFADLCIVTSPDLQGAWEAMNNNALAHRRFERAVAARFPKADLELAGGFTIEVAMNSILKRLPKAKVEISSDKLSATVTYPNEDDANQAKAEPFYLIRDGKGWKIDEVRTEPVDHSQIELAPFLNKESTGLDQLTADIEAGKIRTLDEIKSIFERVEGSSHP